MTEPKRSTKGAPRQPPQAPAPTRPVKPVSPDSKGAGPEADAPQGGLATSSSGNVHAGMSGKNK
jgi:hypothetical protein